MKFYSEIARKPMDMPSLKRRVEKWVWDNYTDSDIEEVRIFFPGAAGTSTSDVTRVQVVLDLRNPDTESSDIVNALESGLLQGTGWQYLEHVHNFDTINITLHAPRERTTQAIPKPRYLYHVTSEKNENRILRQGLVPHPGPRDRHRPEYKSRVYFLIVDLAADDFRDLADYVSVAGGVSRANEVVVFELDTRRFNKFNIFLDEELTADYPVEAAVWTPTHIPAKALEVVYRASEDEMFN